MDASSFDAEQNLYLLYFTGVLFVTATCLFLFHLLRTCFAVSVNCWFCNTNLRVPFHQRNQFICSSCHQYNGFKENGDYNCVIDAQHDASKNARIYHDMRKNGCKPKLNLGNGLCDSCNIQQSLKVRALAEFSSLCDDNIEIEEFRSKLEEMYDLCQQCEATVHQALGKQNSYLKPRLIAWRIHQSKNSKNFVVRKAVVHPASSKLLLGVLFLSSVWLLLSKLAVVCLEFAPRVTSFLHLDGDSEEFCFLIMKIDILFTFTGLMCCSKLYSWESEVSKVFNVIVWLILAILQNDVNVGLLNENSSCYLQVLFSTINMLMMARTIRSISVRSSPTSKPFVFMPTPVIDDQNTTKNTSGVSSPESSSTNSASFMRQSRSDDELGIPLTNLKIGTPQKNVTRPGSQGIFSTQSLSNPKSCSFDTLSQSSWRSPSILQPSKLCSKITQSSWVAGGYWGESPKRRQNVSDLHKRNEEFDLFSQSSSKSSGFHSQGSGSTGLYWPQYKEQPQIPRRNLNSKWGHQDERRSLDSVDAYSVSSYSTACRTDKGSLSQRDWRPSQEHELYSGWKLTPDQSFSSNENSVAIKSSILPTEKNLSWCYVWLSFALGFSFSANLFFFYLFFKIPIEDRHL